MENKNQAENYLNEVDEINRDVLKVEIAICQAFLDILDDKQNVLSNICGDDIELSDLDKEVYKSYEHQLKLFTEAIK